LIQTYGNHVHYVALFVYLHNYRQADMGAFHAILLCKFHHFFCILGRLMQLLYSNFANLHIFCLTNVGDFGS